ncbi:MAG: cation:proton antiporter [Spirochaetes bacterium]|jgi:CPA2 family monovalent cation:H+ antiporter-2|nr:cation:proton antiporter [Spirochaetota bacterium]
MGIAEDLVLIVIAGFFFGFIANRLKVPAFVGYIIAGIFIGPHTGGITVGDTAQIELLAEIGVALLLFSIGLDLSLKELSGVKLIALIGTPIQLVLSIACGFFIGRLLGFRDTQSIVLGVIISLSSTMIVLKFLSGRGLIGALSARVMIGMLIVQDLAAIPLMIVIPYLGNMNYGLSLIPVVILKAFILILITLTLGMKAIPYVLRHVSRLNSRELFLVSITAICLGVGYISHLFGLSMALGAFMAGMAINQSDYSYRSISDISPLKDIFGLIFFTSIGMLLDPSYILKNITMISIIVALVMSGKMIIFSGIAVLFKYRNIVPLALALGLSQIGEFSFIIARSGVNSGIIDKEFYTLLLSVITITMLISPFLSTAVVPLYALKKSFFRKEAFNSVNIPVVGLENHIVIAGGGRVGYIIGEILNDLGFSFIIIEQDYRRFEAAKNSGFPAIYGDASSEPVLNASCLMDSILLIITVPSSWIAIEIASASKKINNRLVIIARSGSEDGARGLEKTGVNEVIQPEFEGGLEMLRKSLLHLGISAGSIQRISDDIRRKNYGLFINDRIDKELLLKMKDSSLFLETGWYVLDKNSSAAGKAIGDLKIRTSTGASIVAVLRDGNVIPNPETSFIVMPDDYLAVIGDSESRKKFEQFIKSI